MSFVINALVKYIGVEDELTPNASVINEETQDAYTETVAPTVEKSCKCGFPATIYNFGKIEDGKSDWTFYCNTCNPHSLPIKRRNTVSAEKPICKRCGKPGERYCFGEFASGKFDYGFFCLDCRPHHF